MSEEPNPRSIEAPSGRALHRRRFAILGAAILVIGALSMLVLSDFDLLESAEENHGASGKGSVLALANPASVNCAEKGGASELRNGDGGQIGYCRFPDGRICEEWALFRENRCVTPPGGR